MVIFNDFRDSRPFRKNLPCLFNSLVFRAIITDDNLIRLFGLVDDAVQLFFEKLFSIIGAHGNGNHDFSPYDAKCILSIAQNSYFFTNHFDKAGKDSLRDERQQKFK